MIYIDTSVILRYLTSSSVPKTQRLEREASALFAAISRGELTATFSEVVLHEVAYVLTSKRNYDLDRDFVMELLRTIVEMPSFQFHRGQKAHLLRAIELFGSHSTIGMADALMVAHAETRAIPLATFDESLDKLPYAESWTFSA